MRVEDKRLEKPVTVYASRVYLSELLECLAAQSGVALTTDEQDAASGVQVTCRCEQVPLGNILDGLYALVSTRNGDWLWQRSGRLGAFRYALKEPNYAKERAVRWREYTQKALEEYIAVMIEFAYMSPEQRQRDRRRLKQVIGAEDDTLVERLLNSERRWQDMRLLAEIVPPEARLALLRDRKSFAVAIKDLPPQTQSLVHTFFSGFRIETIQADGTKIPDPQPESLRYSVHSANGSDRALIPDVAVEVGKGATVTITGSSYLEGAIFAALKQAWMLPLDSADNLVAQRMVKEKVDTIAPPQTVTLSSGHALRLPLPTNVLELRLSQLSQGASLPILMLLPNEQGRDLGTPTGQTVQSYLSKIGKAPLRTMTKWRGNMLLVNYAGWFFEEDSAVPYALIERYLRGKDGFVRLPNLAKLMSAITEAQAAHLAEEYPVLRDAFPLRPWLALYGALPAILSEGGVPLDNEKIAALRQSPQSVIASAIAKANGAATALRLAQQETRVHNRRQITIRSELLVDGKWVFVNAFTQVVDASSK